MAAARSHGTPPGHVMSLTTARTAPKASSIARAVLSPSGAPPPWATSSRPPPPPPRMPAAVRTKAPAARPRARAASLTVITTVGRHARDHHHAGPLAGQPPADVQRQLADPVSSRAVRDPVRDERGSAHVLGVAGQAVPGAAQL